MRILTSLLIVALCLAPCALARADEDPKVLKVKVTKLVDQKFGGDWDRAYRHYADLGEIEGGQLERSDLKNLLEDAGVGNWMTRAMKLLDKDDSGRISKVELRWTDYNTHDPGTTTPE